MMFIELGFNGKFTFSQKDFPKKIRYIRINGTDKNKYLFQKEHLWNIAAKTAKHEKLMFIDSDMAPEDDCDWFNKVYDVLDKSLFAQGFKTLKYLDKSQNPTGMVKSSTASRSLTHKSNPGGVYCICKSTLNVIGGFNYLPFGGGDDLFWRELLGEQHRFPQILTATMRKSVRQ